MIFAGIQAWKSMIAHLAEVGDHADPANSSPDTKRASVEEALWGLREEARCSIRNFLEHNIWNPLLGHTITGPFQDLMRALTRPEGVSPPRSQSSFLSQALIS